MWTCREVKRTGWNRLQGAFWTAVLLTLVFALISGALPFLQSAIRSFQIFSQSKFHYFNYSGSSGMEDIGKNSMTYSSQMLLTNSMKSILSLLSIVATFLLINPISVGYVRWFLTYRNENGKPSISILFSSFKSAEYGPTVGGMAWQTLWLMIWGVVAAMCLAPFIVITIIFFFMASMTYVDRRTDMNANGSFNLSTDNGAFAQKFHDMAPTLLIVILILFLVGMAAYLAILLNRKYAYMFTPFIIAEKSNFGAAKALNLSKQMTHGMKGKLFVLDLSFIGWWMLSMLTCGLLSFGIIPYMYATYTEVYMKRKEELAIALT